MLICVNHDGKDLDCNIMIFDEGFFIREHPTVPGCVDIMLAGLGVEKVVTTTRQKEVSTDKAVTRETTRVRVILVTNLRQATVVRDNTVEKIVGRRTQARATAVQKDVTQDCVTIELEEWE